jgi:hypothetical protein
MSIRRRTSRLKLTRGASPASNDASFPRAVPGEDYDRFARAMIWQGERWLRIQISDEKMRATETHELRVMLRAVAVAELQRDLHDQEERLLSELLQQRTDTAGRRESVEPEIPSFLLGRTGS